MQHTDLSNDEATDLTRMVSIFFTLGFILKLTVNKSRHFNVNINTLKYLLLSCLSSLTHF